MTSPGGQELCLIAHFVGCGCGQYGVCGNGCFEIFRKVQELNLEEVDGKIVGHWLSVWTNLMCPASSGRRFTLSCKAVMMGVSLPLMR